VVGRRKRWYLKRMETLGLNECRRKSTGQLTPTFPNPRGGGVNYQMDYLFVTQALSNRLTVCTTGSRERVFESKLSDHLPIIARFDIGD
jgi:endonuclease/exonuclease/phosphatase (EEP) superfamily protein YafD